MKRGVPQIPLLSPVTIRFCSNSLRWEVAEPSWKKRLERGRVLRFADQPGTLSGCLYSLYKFRMCGVV